MCTTSRTMAVKLKKVTSKLLTEEAKQVRGDHVVTEATFTGDFIGPQGMLTWMARKHSRNVGTWARELTKHFAREHVSMQDTLARKHVNTQGMSAREHVSTQSTLPRENVSMQSKLARSMQDTLEHEHVSTEGTLPRKTR